MRCVSVCSRRGAVGVHEYDIASDDAASVDVLERQTGVILALRLTDPTPMLTLSSFCLALNCVTCHQDNSPFTNYGKMHSKQRGH